MRSFRLFIALGLVVVSCSGKPNPTVDIVPDASATGGASQGGATATVSGGATLTGGKTALDPGTCGDAAMTASLSAFDAAFAKLFVLQNAVTSSVGLACANIAVGLGDSSSLPSFTQGQAASSTDIARACDAASSQLAIWNSAFPQSSQVTMGASQCSVDAAAQLTCQQTCDGPTGCSTPSYTQACPQGELSGACVGSCNGSCIVELSAATSCPGTCDGTCIGSCGAVTSSVSPGVPCSGTCTGQCQGRCALTSGSAQDCAGICKGSCSIDFMNPRCDVALSVPPCDAAASCNTYCSDAALFAVACTQPSVLVTTFGNPPSSYKSVIEANLPFLIVASAQSQLAHTAVSDFGTTAASTAGALQSLGNECSAQVADLASKVSAAAAAAVNIQAAFAASSSIRARVGG